MKLMKTEDAVGQVLCHDITQIIKGVTKDAVFRKGHIITEEDIPVLLSVGKDNIYIWEKDDTMLHENEAAQILYDMCKNDHMHPSDVKEGKIELLADVDGLFQVDVERLYDVNSVDEIMIATRHTNTAVKKGDKLAGMRVIPLIIDEKRLEEAEKKARELIARVGLTDRINNYPCQLSGGQQQRVLLARALCAANDLLILDEPTSGLDPVSRDELMELFRGVVKSGERSILFSTHITSDLEKCASHITMIKDGQILCSDTRDGFLARYRAQFGDGQMSLEDILVRVERRSYDSEDFL